jgi:hypothetical protein
MREYHVLNLGAGVQSTALYLMFMRGQIKPTINCAVFADTQDEPDEVYRHLNWLQSLGGPPILVRSKGSLSECLKRGENGTGGRFASIPAFTLRPDGSEGKTRRQCSSEFKIAVIQQTIRRDVMGFDPGVTPRGVVCHQYFGISLDEAGRARRIAAAKRPRYFKVAFPLVDHLVTRANCLEFLREKVPHQTPRSACVYCPFHSDEEWQRIRDNDPAGWAKAVAVDHSLRVAGNVVNRNMDQELFVHRSCVPLDQVRFKVIEDPRKRQAAFNFSSECLGVCGV